MKIKKIVLAAIIPLALSACSRLLPLDYTNYQSSDAATIYVLNQKSNVGTIYLGSYKFNEKDACYDMVDRYQLESNFLESKGKVIVTRVKPGIQYSVSQIKNRGTYRIDSHSSFIPEAGKYYYIASGSKAVEVPASFIPDPNANEDNVVRQYEKTPIKFWNLKKLCSRAWWHVG